MLALPPQREFNFTDVEKYWSEIISMCKCPAKYKGFAVRIIKPIDMGNGNSIPIGRTGIVRPFNPLDFKHLEKEYTDELHIWRNKLPNLTYVYDFFVELKEGGLSLTHVHISRNHFEFLNNQLSIFD